MCPTGGNVHSAPVWVSEVLTHIHCNTCRHIHIQVCKIEPTQRTCQYYQAIYGIFTLQCCAILLYSVTASSDNLITLLQMFCLFFQSSKLCFSLSYAYTEIQIRHTHTHTHACIPEGACTGPVVHLCFTERITAEEVNAWR